MTTPRTRRCVRGCAVALAVWCGAPQTSAGHPAWNRPPTLVATVSVRGSSGRLLTGLPGAAFTVTQEGQAIPWRFIEAAPRDFLLLLDHSGSQAGGRGIEGPFHSDDRRSVRGSALAFRGAEALTRMARSLGDRLDAGDRARVATFGDGGRVSAYAASGEGLAAAITATRQFDAPSPVWDAVFGLPDLFAAAGGFQPVVLVVTDGLATANTRSHGEAVSQIRGSSVMLYATASRIGLDANDRDPTALSPRTALREVAAATGGRLIEIVETSAGVIDLLLEEVSELYTIAITPLDGVAARPDIRVTRGNATVVARWLTR